MKLVKKKAYVQVCGGILLLNCYCMCNCVNSLQISCTLQNHDHQQQ